MNNGTYVKEIIQQQREIIRNIYDRDLFPQEEAIIKTTIDMTIVKVKEQLKYSIKHGYEGYSDIVDALNAEIEVLEDGVE